MTRLVGIHQPNFFPWLGYFDKIARSSTFVVLDDAQHQKTGSNWSNRVRILVNGEPVWVTAPIRRPAHGTQTLAETLWADGPWRDKLWKTLQLQYRRAPHFDEAAALLEPLVRNAEAHLVAYNLHAIRAICAALGIETAIVPASGFGLASTATQRLVDLVQRVGGDGYLAGGGAGGYQDDALFGTAGLHLKYQAFAHPAYPQHGAKDFVPGMSVIDVLMNCGLARTRELLIT